MPFFIRILVHEVHTAPSFNASYINTDFKIKFTAFHFMYEIRPTFTSSVLPNHRYTRVYDSSEYFRYVSMPMDAEIYIGRAHFSGCVCICVTTLSCMFY